MPTSPTTRSRSPRWCRPSTHGADLAIGSRYVAGGSIAGLDVAARRCCRAGATATPRGALGLAVNDSTVGLPRLPGRRAARGSTSAHVRADGYGFQIEMTYRLVQPGGRVVEIPIAFVDRRAGESKMSLPIVVEAFALVTGWGVRDVLTVPAGAGAASR